MNRTIDQNMSIVQVYDMLSDLRWNDSFQEIVDLPDRIGAIDFGQESFRLSYWVYLTDAIEYQERIQAISYHGFYPLHGPECCCNYCDPSEQ
jgi:hypothetical protein